MLLGVLPIAAVAAISLRRPQRKRVVAASVSLWQKVLGEHRAAGKRTRRSPSLSWWCLLAGALCAVLAAAGPELERSPARRQVTIRIYPSAEVTEETFVEATNAILDKLDPADRVRLIRPVPINEGAGEWQSPAQARQSVLSIPQLPATATSLVFPPRDPVDGAELWLAPGGTVTPADDVITLVELSPSLPPVTIERLSATPTDDGWRVDVLFRNHTDEDQSVAFMPSVADADGLANFDPTSFVLLGQPYGATVPANGLGAGTFATSKPFVAVALLGEFIEVESVAYIICDAGQPVCAYVEGDNMTMVHRYIAADPAATTGSLESGELMIFTDAGGHAALRWVPKMTFDDHSGELGYENVTLAEAVINSTHPAMAGVDLSGVAVKELKVFNLIYSGSEVLASYDGKPIIMDVSGTDRPPRIVTSFDISPENTNWTLDESFVVFMANSVRYLVPRNYAQAGYVAPLAAPGWEQWTPLTRGQGYRGGLYLWPTEGFWQDQWGRIHAISLVGLNASEPNASAKAIIEQWSPPGATQAQEVFAFWPILVLAAGGLWLLGWALR